MNTTRSISRRKSASGSRSVVAEPAIEAVAAVGAKTVVRPNVSGMAACIEDARRAALDGDAGPENPLHFGPLMERLNQAVPRFPPLYRAEFVEPYLATLKQLGAAHFADILIKDPKLDGSGGLMMDMAQAILQRAEAFNRHATDAFQEVVGDLYDGFLSAEDRQGVNPPDRGTTPPLVKWGNPTFGPYTWPADATAAFGAHAGVVNLPPANARRGLFAWPALGHETGGHDILHADNGLQDELAQAVHRSVSAIDGSLADYWADRIDETASDVLGILNMGPAAAIGLVVYFRGLGKAFNGRAVLRSEGPADDSHPADVLRGYLGAETVATLPFAASAAWSSLITAETDKDAANIVIAGVRVTRKKARDSARAVAMAVARTKAKSLENHALIDIQTWRDGDEKKVGIVRGILTTAGDLPEQGSDRIYAAHVVAAAVMEALSNAEDIPVIFDRMVNILAKLHAENPVWGPLFVRHPGNIRRDFAYIPSRRIAPGDAALPDIRDGLGGEAG